MKRVLITIPEDLLKKVDRMAKRYSLDRSSYIRTTLSIAIMEFESGRDVGKKR